MTSIIQERRAFTRAKEEGRPCEDVVLGRPQLGRFAMSDGASISYDSRGWARTLCWQFMRDINIDPDWLGRARARFAARATPAEDDWAAILASDRGSLSCQPRLADGPAPHSSPSLTLLQSGSFGPMDTRSRSIGSKNSCVTGNAPPLIPGLPTQ